MRIIVILFILILLNCNYGFDLKDSNKKNGNQSNPVDSSIVDNFDQRINTLFKEYLIKYDTISFEDNTSRYAVILNKSDYKWMKKVHFKIKKPDKNKVGNFYFKVYSYDDTTSCNVAYDNWLNNFGTMAFPIKKNVNLESIHSPPTYGMKSSKEIIILFIDCEENLKEWQSVITFFRSKLESRNEKFLCLECGCGGPISWY